MTERILVTGATGFIGRAVVGELCKTDDEIYVVSRKPNQNLNIKNVIPISCDLLNLSDQKRMFQLVKPTIMIHLAWDVTPGVYWTSLENFKWVQASLELFHYFTKHAGKRFVGIGSCAEYDWKDGFCLEVKTPINPTSLYGTCKASLGNMLFHYAKQTNIGYSWARIFYLYGPHEHSSRLVSSAIQTLLQRKQFNCKNGSLIRDFMYVKVVAKAIIFLARSNYNGFVNVSYGKPISIKTIVTSIAELVNGVDFVQFQNLSKEIHNDPPTLVASTEILNKIVGYYPSYTLEDSLMETINWWKAQLGLEKHAE